MSAENDEIKRKAANVVLGRLGEEMIDVVKLHLRRAYDINFDPKENSKFSLDQLYFGLSVLLGEGLAKNLMGQIKEEIDILSRVQVH